MGQTTLSKFLILHLQKNASEPELAALLVDVAAAVKKITAMISKGSLGGYLTDIPAVGKQGETAKKLDVLSNEAIISACECGGQLAGMLSQCMDAPCEISGGQAQGEYLLVFDPLDGSTNTDINEAVGTVFSILRFTGSDKSTVASYLQPGREQVAAGYAIYGPSTMLVITAGSGAHGFTLDRETGNFILTHPEIRIPRETNEFAIDSSNERYWEPPMQRYISECKEGTSGTRQRDFDTRWIASRVADVHRILMRGGVFLSPRDFRTPLVPGHILSLHSANPLAMVMTQAGGLASTGRKRIEDVEVAELRQRIPLLLGSADEVERIERYHSEYDAGTDEEYVSPLFKERSLFRD